jgi:hypothetical protein
MTNNPILTMHSRNKKQALECRDEVQAFLAATAQAHRDFVEQAKV